MLRINLRGDDPASKFKGFKDNTYWMSDITRSQDGQYSLISFNTV